MLPRASLVSRLAIVAFSFLLLLASLFTSGCVSSNRPAPASYTAASFSVPATDDGLPGTGPIRRADWFQKTWHDRRTSFAATAQQDQGSVVFLGDSITQGWGDRLVPSFPELHVSNRGVSGDTSRGVLVRLPEDVLALNPRGVVLLIGTNDLEEGAAPEIIAGNVKLIIESLRQHDPAMPVVLCAVFPSSATKKRPVDQIKRLNQLYRTIVRDQPQVTYLDTWTLFANAQGDAKSEEFPDLLHPNTIGYAKWTGALRTIFATLGFVDTKSDNFQPEAGFVSLFNDHDLTGWGYRPTTAQDIESAKRWQKSDPAAAAWPVIKDAVNFDHLKATPDGRFEAINGRLVVTSPHEYRKIQQLWTQREFPRDFILKLEFRAAPNTDSGIYVRGPQLQCRDYLLAGPYKALKHYKAGDWNEIVITVKGEAAYCTCNGEVLETAMKVPLTGPIGLEGDRGQMEYRHIQLKELP
ncbi:MAG TPA: GDSL-type esterase/lipase family protein [Lacunisphaera sp.]|jgi:lysophospholipase L1-like esterase